MTISSTYAEPDTTIHQRLTGCICYWLYNSKIIYEWKTILFLHCHAFRGSGTHRTVLLTHSFLHSLVLSLSLIAPFILVSSFTSMFVWASLRVMHVTLLNVALCFSAPFYQFLLKCNLVDKANTHTHKYISGHKFDKCQISSGRRKLMSVCHYVTNKRD